MFFKKKNLRLGVDIGTTSIKMVEAEKRGEKLILKNYAIYSPSIMEDRLVSLDAQNLPLFEKEVSAVILMMLQQATIQAKKSIFSLPSFSSFFTEIELPPMEEEEIPQAVELQASQYVPVPLSEVTLEWQVVREERRAPQSIWQKPITPLPKERRSLPESLRILIVAIPRVVIERYLKLAESLGLELLALEVENFSLARCLFDKDEKGVQVILDVGGTSSTITVIDGGFVCLSHNLDFSSFRVTKAISKKLNISLSRAFHLQTEKGIREEGSLAKVVILPILDKIRFEMEQTINSYLTRAPNKKIEKIIIAGGGAGISYLKDYLARRLEIETEIANPFKKVIFSSSLEPRLKEIGPRFSVAVGLSLYQPEEK